MPDGRPLALAIKQQHSRPPRSGGSRRRPGQGHKEEGWTKPLPRAAQQATAVVGKWAMWRCLQAVVSGGVSCSAAAMFLTALPARPPQPAPCCAASSDVQSDAEAAEMYALSRVGQRKQRRW